MASLGVKVSGVAHVHQRRYEYMHHRVETLTDVGDSTNWDLVTAMNDMDADGWEVIAVEFGAIGNYIHIIGRRKV